MSEWALRRIDAGHAGIICLHAALSAVRWEPDRMSRRLQRCPALAAAFLLVFGVVIAEAAPVAATLTTSDTLQLQRVAAYLNAIRTMTATFEQVANNGAVSDGRVWLARPGRMRFQYGPPDPITLLADATSVYYRDPQLGQTSKYDLRQTPAWFFLRDPISFGSDVIVTQFQHAAGVIRVTVVEAARPDAGSLTLVFSENPLMLRQWIVVDQQRKTTSVTLHNMQFGMALDPNMFQYQSLFTGSNR
jgi:outer membrane lipoprotein-sorting protein